MAIEVLGARKKKFLFKSYGIIPQEQAIRLAQSIIAFIGMREAREGRVDPYPYGDGGGYGYTGFFSLMESYLMMDVYTDINETEILISTCKPERLDPQAVTSYLANLIGPTVYVGSL